MPGARAVLALAVLVSWADIASTTLCNDANFTSWFDSMLSEYNRGERPVGPNLTNEESPQRPLVGLGMRLRHVTLQEVDSDARITGDMYYDWNDNRLTWNASEWACDTTLIAAELIWFPHIAILNDGARNNVVSETPPARLSANGSVTVVASVDFAVPIHLKLQSWPGDTQRVELKFASAMGILMSEDWMELIVKDRKFSETKSTGAWEVTSIKSSVVREAPELEVSGDSKVFHDTVIVQLAIARRAPAHSLATLAVLLAVMVELAAATMIPPDSRTPLCACAAFTAALWLSSSLVRIPSATSTPLALWLMGMVCVAGAATSLASALVGLVAKLQVTPPGLVKRVLNSASGLCELTPDQSTSEAERGAWAAAARLLDLLLTNVLRFALFLMLCVYVFS